MAESRRLSVIVFTDIVGYSRMVQADEALALELVAEHNRILAERIEAHGGRTLKTAGDSFMAAFDSAADAVTATAEIQAALATRNETAPAERQVHVRIGVHAGDVVFTTDSTGAADALGDGVNVASRIEAQAGAGQVYVSHDVFSMTYERVPYGYRDIGARELKNISRPVHLYELLWDPARAGEADARPPRAGGGSGSRVGWLVGAIAVLAAIAVVVFHSTPAEEEGQRADGRPSLVVVGVVDATGDERLARMQIGPILDDAVEQKFYDYRPVHLVSPLRVDEVRRDLGHAVGAELDAAAVADVARRAGGRLVVWGRLARLGDTFVLSAELSDLADGASISRVQHRATAEGDLLGLVDSVCVRFQQRLVDVLGIGTLQDVVLAPVGDLTTHSLPAYEHFRRGYDLYHGGLVLEGAMELARAVDVDTTFALAASDAACAFSFAKRDSLSAVYLEHARRHAGPRLRRGTSKAALIFQGNDAWLAGTQAAEAPQARAHHEKAVARYAQVVELYPDDPDGYYYLGLAHQYLLATGADGDDDLRRATELYGQAAERHPGYFPIYYDWSTALQALEGPGAADRLLTDYLRQYGDGPGAAAARQARRTLRGEG